MDHVAVQCGEKMTVSTIEGIYNIIQAREQAIISKHHIVSSQNLRGMKAYLTNIWLLCVIKTGMLIKESSQLIMHSSIWRH